MNPEKQRIVIAEKYGWKWYRRPATGPWAVKPMRWMLHPDLHRDYIDEKSVKLADMTERQCGYEFIWREGNIPDYLNDLNAVHEAEKLLTINLPPIPHKESERTRYVGFLVDMCGDKGACLATAAKRCEAMLRTWGLWEEGE